MHFCSASVIDSDAAVSKSLEKPAADRSFSAKSIHTSTTQPSGNPRSFTMSVSSFALSFQWMSLTESWTRYSLTW